MTSIVPLVTPRLVLRPLQPEDGVALLPLIQNWDVVKWLSVVPWPYTERDMDWFITEIAAPRSTMPEPIYAILLDGAPIGTAECKAANPGEPPVLGFWIGEPHWGQGFMREAASALIDRAFATTSTDAVVSGVFKGNERSFALHRRVGFARSGMTMMNCAARATQWPLITLWLSRERWHAHSGANR